MTTMFSTRSNVRNLRALSNDELRSYAPAIFAEHPFLGNEEAKGVSAKYTFIPTINFVEGLRQNGFYPVSVVSSRTRIAGKRDFVKHMIKFNNDATIAALGRAVGDIFPQVSMTNAHDAGGSCIFEKWLLRLACLNGMTVSMGQSDIVRVAHRGTDAVELAVQGAQRISQDFARIGEQVRVMEQIQLRPAEQELFAEQAIALRYDVDAEHKAPITPVQILQVRRAADNGSDLWKTYNRIQEALTKGGVNGVSSDGQRRRTREVKSIDENTRLNRALWALTQGMARLAGGVDMSGVIDVTPHN